MERTEKEINLFFGSWQKRIKNIFKYLPVLLISIANQVVLMLTSNIYSLFINFRSLTLVRIYTREYKQKRNGVIGKEFDKKHDTLPRNEKSLFLLFTRPFVITFENVFPPPFLTILMFIDLYTGSNGWIFRWDDESSSRCYKFYNVPDLVWRKTARDGPGGCHTERVCLFWRS